jgi:proteic killer suppression protein
LEIGFKSAKLEKIFNSASAMQAEFGSEQAKKIQLRLSVLRNASNLDEVPAMPPDRRHELKGKYAGCFAVDVKQPYRLIFKPDYENTPCKPDGGIDLRKVTKIKILGVEDYH